MYIDDSTNLKPRDNVDWKLVSYGVLVVGKTCMKNLVRMSLSDVKIICICLAYFQKMANSWTNRVKFLVRWVLPYRATTVQRHFQQCIKPPVFPERYSYVCVLDNTLELFFSSRHSLLMYCKSPCRNVCHFTSIYIYIHLNLCGSHYLQIVMISLVSSLCTVYINFFRTVGGFSHKVPFLYLLFIASIIFVISY